MMILQDHVSGGQAPIIGVLYMLANRLFIAHSLKI